MIISLLCLLVIASYLLAVHKSNGTFKKWPFQRIIYFSLGVFSIYLSVTGPLAEIAHEDFIYHMVIHLLLGMLAPLLLVLSAPMILVLRTVHVEKARLISRFFRSRFVRFYRNPIVASVLNIGGLWVFYTTPLFEWTQQSMMLHTFVHIHVFIAGYLFTVSLLYIDPAPIRYSYLYRTIVFIFAVAGHGILTKYIYANPPKGVAINEAEVGAMIMYYGGDAIDMIIIIILFYQWYQATKPRELATTSI